MQRDCRNNPCLARQLRQRYVNGAPARQLLLRCPTFRHLTVRDGGNAKGLLGTIPAMHVSSS